MIINNDSKYTLIKIWHSFREKSIKLRKLEKISSKYLPNDDLQQLSDNESDKTETENINKKEFNERCRRISRMSSSSKSDNNKLYDKRDNSLDIIRNRQEDYEVVMQYQRYSNKKTKKKSKEVEIFNIEEIKK